MRHIFRHNPPMNIMNLPEQQARQALSQHMQAQGILDYSVTEQRDGKIVRLTADGLGIKKHVAYEE